MDGGHTAMWDRWMHVGQMDTEGAHGHRGTHRDRQTQGDVDTWDGWTRGDRRTWDRWVGGQTDTGTDGHVELCGHTDMGRGVGGHGDGWTGGQTDVGVLRGGRRTQVQVGVGTWMDMDGHGDTGTHGQVDMGTWMDRGTHRHHRHRDIGTQTDRWTWGHTDTGTWGRRDR